MWAGVMGGGAAVMVTATVVGAAVAEMVCGGGVVCVRVRVAATTRMEAMRRVAVMGSSQVWRRWRVFLQGVAPNRSGWSSWFIEWPWRGWWRLCGCGGRVWSR